MVTSGRDAPRYVRDLPADYAAYVVVDASVAVKWVVDEPHAELARHYAEGAVDGRVRLAAPSLFWYELANVLRYRTEGDARAWQFLCAVPVETVELVPEAFAEVEALARNHGVSAYDAAYVFLARTLQVPLITADVRLAERCKDLRFVWPLTLFQ